MITLPLAALAWFLYQGREAPPAPAANPERGPALLAGDERRLAPAMEGARAAVRRDGFRTALPPLAQSPEAYANSADNPFACSPMYTRVDRRFCDWRNDPRVARSPAEARWMRRQGYPTLAHREWALHRSADEIEAEARRSGLVALWTLALERRLGEAETAAQAEDVPRRLNHLAAEGRSLYALEQASLAWLQVAQMKIVETGSVPVEGGAASGVGSALRIAVGNAVKIGVLGDAAGMKRILAAVRSAAPPGHQTDAEPNGLAVADLVEETYADLRREQALAAQGRRRQYGGFTLADIAPRPEPMEINGEHGEPVWIGER